MSESSEAAYKPQREPAWLARLTAANVALIRQGPDDGSLSAAAEDAPFPTQADVLAWVARRWPNLTGPLDRAAKHSEEAGEVIGAVIKTMDGTGRKTKADIAQESAQAAIALMGLAESVGFDLWAEVANEYARCQP